MDNPVISHLRKPPGFKKIKRALFIQPHPDDNQIGAGGLMAYLVDKGCEVYELTVTDDRKLEPGVFLTTRQKEANDSAAYLGVKNTGFLGFSDKMRESEQTISEAILPVIRKIQPDAVFTVDPLLSTECHSDHIKTGNAVKYAVMDAVCDFYPYTEDGSRQADAWTVDTLGFYYTDKPNNKIDITKYIDRKIESVKLHKSQVDNMLLIFIKELAKMAAKGTKYKYAEQYRMLSSLHMHCFNIPLETATDE